MNKYLKSTLLTIKSLKVPHADTVLRDLKKPSTPELFISHTKIEHQTKINDKLILNLENIYN